MFQIIFTLAFLITSVFTLPAQERRATVCNGHAELCNRSYGNVTYLAAHDSFSISQDPLALARNQEIDLTSQMKLGVRALQAQSHMNNGVLHFCHTSCSLFDGGTVLAYLQTVKSFLDANPNEVFTLIFTNPERVSPKDIWDPIFQQSGIASLVYTPPNLPMKATDWPTLGQMIDSGKRVVVFMDYGSNTADVPYILPEFDHVWEPPFSSTDPTFPCRVDRISGPLSSQDHMFMINHNLNVQVFPTSTSNNNRRSPNPTPLPGWFGDLTSAIGNGIGHATSVIGNGIGQATSVVGAQVGQATSIIGNGVSSAVQAFSSIVSVGEGQLSGILVPDYLHAGTTNGIQSIMADTNGCAPYSGGKAASFVLLDFVDIGEGIKAVNMLNGLA